MPFPRSSTPPLTAGSMHPSKPYHVLTPPAHPSDSGRPACGSGDYAVMSQRADLVPLALRCAASGCYERWPWTPAATEYLRVATSAWGQRAADPEGDTR